MHVLLQIDTYKYCSSCRFLKEFRSKCEMLFAAKILEKIAKKSTFTIVFKELRKIKVFSLQ